MSCHTNGATSHSPSPHSLPTLLSEGSVRVHPAYAQSNHICAVATALDLLVGLHDQRPLSTPPRVGSATARGCASAYVLVNVTTRQRFCGQALDPLAPNPR